MSKLIFNPTDSIRFATNTFTNVPTILQYEETPLFEVVKNEKLQFTSQVSIFHPDGTYLAKAKGPRLYPTEDGKKANLSISTLADRRICKLDNHVIFELRKTSHVWEADAELYAPDGTFIRERSNEMPQLFPKSSDEPFQLGGIIMQDNSFVGCKIGILIMKNGDIFIAVNDPDEILKSNK